MRKHAGNHQLSRSLTIAQVALKPVDPALPRAECARAELLLEPGGSLFQAAISVCLQVAGKRIHRFTSKILGDGLLYSKKLKTVSLNQGGGA